MDGDEWLADRFEEHRAHLRAVAYRMLGSMAEADDAVQEAWLRLSRSEPTAIENLGAWLTTVVSRVCLDVLRARRRRPVEDLSERLPDVVVSGAGGLDPEDQALVADSLGLALLVVLESLGPAERLAFVLHDMFGMSYDEIAPLVDRTPPAARQLASRARRRVRGAAPTPEPDLARQRQVVDAYLAAARNGDLQALIAVLDPDVVLRADLGALATGGLRRARGAGEVADRALSFRGRELVSLPALVNGAAGLVNTEGGRPVSVMGFTITAGKIAAIDILADPDRLSRLDLSALETGEDLGCR